mgnify:CR=1 FL=1
MIKYLRKSLFLGLVLFVVSCSNTSFVVQQHNQFVNNLFDNGYIEYGPMRTISTRIENIDSIVDKCEPYPRYTKLNRIVPIPEFSNCTVHLNYEYLVSLQNYVRENNIRKYGELILIDSLTFDDTLYYHMVKYSNEVFGTETEW